MDENNTLTLIILVATLGIVALIVWDYVYYHPRRMSDDEIVEALEVLATYHSRFTKAGTHSGMVKQIEKRQSKLLKEQRRRAAEGDPQ